MACYRRDRRRAADQGHNRRNMVYLDVAKWKHLIPFHRLGLSWQRTPSPFNVRLAIKPAPLPPTFGSIAVPPSTTKTTARNGKNFTTVNVAVLGGDGVATGRLLNSPNRSARRDPRDRSIPLINETS